MKSAIVLVSTAVMVGALHQGTPAAGQKLPWIEDAFLGGAYCSMSRETSWAFEHTEEKCGTERFCNAFDDQQKMKDYLEAEPQYKNAKECIDAHESKPAAAAQEAPLAAPKKLPFIPSGSFGGMYCGSLFEYNEEDCGTEKFCNAFNDRQVIKVGPQFRNAKECMDAHEPRSS